MSKLGIRSLLSAMLALDCSFTRRGAERLLSLPLVTVLVAGVLLTAVASAILTVPGVYAESLISYGISAAGFHDPSAMEVFADTFIFFFWPIYPIYIIIVTGLARLAIIRKPQASILSAIRIAVGSTVAFLLLGPVMDAYSVVLEETHSWAEILTPAGFEDAVWDWYITIDRWGENFFGTLGLVLLFLCLWNGRRALTASKNPKPSQPGCEVSGQLGSPEVPA